MRGVVIGALAGLTAAAIAMTVPSTYHPEPLAALALLYVIGRSGRYGGSVSAIPLDTPGTTASVATMIDGHPLARRGEAVRALRTANVASVLGDLAGDVIGILGAVRVARSTAQFGPPETFAVHAMAFLVIGSVAGRSVLKGPPATLLGVAAALVGLAPITGQARWTLGAGAGGRAPAGAAPRGRLRRLRADGPGRGRPARPGRSGEGASPRAT